jgi:hypothetical protein
MNGSTTGLIAGPRLRNSGKSFIDHHPVSLSVAPPGKLDF